MAKLWLCGICQNNLKEIDELTRDVHFLVDGLVWADHISNDGTYELLQERKGQGHIVSIPFIKDHAWSMNAYLKSGTIQHKDWVLQLDTSERVHPDFVKKLKDTMLDNFEKQNINLIYQRSKPILFRYHDYQYYAGTPHWGIQNAVPHFAKINEFDGFKDDKTYLWSLRDDINKWIVNGIKYYLTYPISNHMWLIHGKERQEVIHAHELQRHDFRNYCRDELKLDINTAKDITEFMKAGNLPERFIAFMNYEKVIANYYRYVNGENQQVIYDTQNTWKYPLN